MAAPYSVDEMTAFFDTVIEELITGNRRQGQGKLRVLHTPALGDQPPVYDECCLGVICDMHPDIQWKVHVEHHPIYAVYDLQGERHSSDEFLPHDFAARIPTLQPLTDPHVLTGGPTVKLFVPYSKASLHFGNLTDLNDGGMPFAAIALIIKRWNDNAKAARGYKENVELTIDNTYADYKRRETMRAKALLIQWVIDHMSNAVRQLQPMADGLEESANFPDKEVPF